MSHQAALIWGICSVSTGAACQTSGLGLVSVGMPSRANTLSATTGLARPYGMQPRAVADWDSQPSGIRPHKQNPRRNYGLLMTTSAYYDHIADSYDQSIQLMPVRQFVEVPSVLRMLGDVRGQRVLDLACGTGFIRGPASEPGRPRWGVDLSSEMLRAAEEIEKATQLGITFRQGDATKLLTWGPFDVVPAVYLLHYAPSLDALKAMCQGIARHLKPGVVGLSFVLNPSLAPDPTYYREYGLVHQEARSPKGWAGRRRPSRIGDLGAAWAHRPSLGSKRRSKRAARRWLTAVRFQPPEASPQGIEKHGAAYWRNLPPAHCVLLQAMRLKLSRSMAGRCSAAAALARVLLSACQACCCVSESGSRQRSGGTADEAKTAEVMAARSMPSRRMGDAHRRRSPPSVAALKRKMTRSRGVAGHRRRALPSRCRAYAKQAGHQRSGRVPAQRGSRGLGSGAGGDKGARPRAMRTKPMPVMTRRKRSLMAPTFAPGWRPGKALPHSVGRCLWRSSAQTSWRVAIRNTRRRPSRFIRSATVLGYQRPPRAVKPCESSLSPDLAQAVSGFLQVQGQTLRGVGVVRMEPRSRSLRRANGVALGVLGAELGAVRASAMVRRRAPS